MISTNRLQQSRFALGCWLGCRILLLCTGLSLCNLALAGDYTDREAAQRVIAAGSPETGAPQRVKVTIPPNSLRDGK